METGSLLPAHQPIALIDAGNEGQHDDVTVVATQDHELIRRRAARRAAEPATGEATETGPATMFVNDDGTGVRFNFPGAGRLRPIGWDEWFRNFDGYSLVFVYERDVAGSTPSARYRLLTLEALKRVADLR